MKLNATPCCIAMYLWRLILSLDFDRKQIYNIPSPPLIVLEYVTSGVCGNSQSLCGHQKTDEDEDPDVLFIKEEHSELEEQESQTRGGMTLQDGFVESSTDICGNRVSPSPAQITLALNSHNLESSGVKGESSLKGHHQGTSSQSPDMQITIQNVGDSQAAGPLCSHEPVLPQGDVQVWDIPTSQSLLQASDESSNISLSHQTVQRKTIVPVDVLGTNSTLYERSKELESSLPQWAANSPTDSQPSCSYIVEADQDCVFGPARTCSC
ncbi:hypothetical protein Baya_1904 [Bagarius yarrelli]|uniref:Uncharacterized protein n=1 Tax=Bagarius yarrelli TaxID=175774 RepID=A0A556TMG2_BAGYA|nr:hypothetical protein Baya_1904 [Bagarius yarrelli]